MPNERHIDPFITFFAVGLIGLGISGCANFQTKAVTSLQTPAGQLFCQVNTVAGPTVVSVIDGAAAGLGPVQASAAVIVTGLAASVVQKDCALAAASVGALTGIPVSPPAVAVGSVAITPVVATPAPASH